MSKENVKAYHSDKKLYKIKDMVMANFLFFKFVYTVQMHKL